jgi:hypothetical protein
VEEYFYEKYISKYTAWKKLPTNNYLALFTCSTIYYTHKHYLGALGSKQNARTCTQEGGCIVGMKLMTWTASHNGKIVCHYIVSNAMSCFILLKVSVMN